MALAQNIFHTNCCVDFNDLCKTVKNQKMKNVFPYLWCGWNNPWFCEMWLRVAVLQCSYGELKKKSTWMFATAMSRQLSGLGWFSQSITNFSNRLKFFID